MEYVIAGFIIIIFVIFLHKAVSATQNKKITKGDKEKARNIYIYNENCLKMVEYINGISDYYRSKGESYLISNYLAVEEHGIKNGYINKEFVTQKEVYLFSSLSLLIEIENKRLEQERTGKKTEQKKTEQQNTYNKQVPRSTEVRKGYKDYCNILGLSEVHTLQQRKVAYRSKMKMYHSDMLVNKSAAEKLKGEEMSRLVNTAYAYLDKNFPINL